MLQQVHSRYATIFNLSAEGRAYNENFIREAKHPINRGNFSTNDFQMAGACPEVERYHIYFQNRRATLLPISAAKSQLPQPRFFLLP
jgi:hypothetical protein